MKGSPNMPGTWRTVRVFISSTFRDMQAERDRRLKSVVPAPCEGLVKKLRTLELEQMGHKGHDL
jgi:hypothetical protein